MISENPKRVTNQSGLLIKSVPKIIKGDNKHTIKAYLSLIFHKNPDTDIDAGKPKQTLHDKREQLSDLVVGNHLTIKDMFQWGELFK